MAVIGSQVLQGPSEAIAQVDVLVPVDLVYPDGTDGITVLARHIIHSSGIRSIHARVVERRGIDNLILPVRPG